MLRALIYTCRISCKYIYLLEYINSYHSNRLMLLHANRVLGLKYVSGVQHDKLDLHPPFYSDKLVQTHTLAYTLICTPNHILTYVQSCAISIRQSVVYKTIIANLLVESALNSKNRIMIFLASLVKS